MLDVFPDRLFREEKQPNQIPLLSSLDQRLRPRLGGET